MNGNFVDNVLQTCKGLRDKHQYHDAINTITEALRTHQDDRLYFARGFLYELIEQPEQAVTEYSKAIELSPNSAKYHFNRGSVLSHSLARDHEAISDFERVLELELDNVDAHREACLSLLVLGRASQAWEHARAALKLAPTEAATQFCAGQAKRSLKQFADAIDFFSHAVHLDPSKGYYWSALGDVLEMVGGVEKLESARQAYSRAIQLSPDSALSLYSRAHVSRRLGMINEAVEDLRHALTLNPDEVTKHLIEMSLSATASVPPPS